MGNKPLQYLIQEDWLSKSWSIHSNVAIENDMIKKIKSWKSHNSIKYKKQVIKQNIQCDPVFYLKTEVSILSCIPELIASNKRSPILLMRVQNKKKIKQFC